LSIVGALVIGQAAVEAHLVAAPIIIIVALAGVSILLVPRLLTTGLIGRYGCLALGSMFGLTGVLTGMSFILIHMINIRSFGVSMFMPVEGLRYQNIKDTFFRAPWPKMKTRTETLTHNLRRASEGDGK
jgi:spore germination protein KA